MLFIIQPLEQRIIYKGRHFTGAEHWALDQLTVELEFEAEITTSSNIIHVLNRAKGLTYQGKWVLILAKEKPYQWDEIWPQAVEMLGRGKGHTLDELLSQAMSSEIFE